MTKSILNLARPEIVAMNAYRSARSEQNKGDVWLDANENPWDISQNFKYNRYPEPQPDQLVTLLSSIYSVRPEQILVTRGCDEGIDLLIRTFCRAGQDAIMICPPTYGMYKVAATIQGAGVVELPLIKNQDFSLDTTNILKKWKPNIKMIFLCSPNNPTGNLLARNDVLSVCQKLSEKAVIIIDEAYIEFSMRDSMVKYFDEYPNLVVLRTLSKAFGLAGIRCGTTLANPEIIQLLKKVIAPYPIPKPIANIVSEQLTSEARDTLTQSLKVINDEKEKLENFLVKLPFVKKVWKSQANFLLFEVSNVQSVINICQNKGIVLRNRSDEYDLTNCIRVTIGTPNENKFLMEVLSNV